MPDAPPSRDPLHGITLEHLLTELVDHFGWEELGCRVPVRCFQFDPSVKSSLTFLRRTPWARAKVEALYVDWKQASPPAPPAPPTGGEPATKRAGELTPEEQMERFARELKETDWGHQPC